MSCSISRTDEDVLVGQLRALLQDANVNCPVNRELLLVFLRVRKLDVNRAVRLVKNYLKLLKNSPELTGDLRLPSLRNALEQDVVFTSRSRDKHGRRLFISLLGTGAALSDSLCVSLSLSERSSRPSADRSVENGQVLAGRNVPAARLLPAAHGQPSRDAEEGHRRPGRLRRTGTEPRAPLHAGRGQERGAHLPGLVPHPIPGHSHPQRAHHLQNGRLHHLALPVGQDEESHLLPRPERRHAARARRSRSAARRVRRFRRLPPPDGLPRCPPEEPGEPVRPDAQVKARRRFVMLAVTSTLNVSH